MPACFIFLDYTRRYVCVESFRVKKEILQGLKLKVNGHIDR